MRCICFGEYWPRRDVHHQRFIRAGTSGPCAVWILTDSAFPAEFVTTSPECESSCTVTNIIHHISFVVHVYTLSFIHTAPCQNIRYISMIFITLFDYDILPDYVSFCFIFSVFSCTSPDSNSTTAAICVEMIKCTYTMDVTPQHN